VAALGPDIGWHFQKALNEPVTFWRFAIGVWDVKLFQTSPVCAHSTRTPLPLIATTSTLSKQSVAIVPSAIIQSLLIRNFQPHLSSPVLPGTVLTGMALMRTSGRDEARKCVSCDRAKTWRVSRLARPGCRFSCDLHQMTGTEI
jgi:hypothetical protein